MPVFASWASHAWKNHCEKSEVMSARVYQPASGFAKRTSANLCAELAVERQAACKNQRDERSNNRKPKLFRLCLKTLTGEDYGFWPRKSALLLAVFLLQYCSSSLLARGQKPQASPHDGFSDRAWYRSESDQFANQGPMQPAVSGKRGRTGNDRRRGSTRRRRSVCSGSRPCRR